jgi:hypothetical protein
LRVRRTIEVLETERGGWIAMGALVACSIGLSLWLTRSTTFFVDDLWYFDSYHGFDVAQFLSQHNGHLVLIPRLIYAASFALFGSDFFFLRLVEAVAVGACGALAYMAAKRGVGSALALAFAAPLLFLGPAWDAALATVGIPATVAVALGLGAMLAATGESPRPWLACILLTLSVLTFSVGLAFCVGAAAVFLVREDRWRHAYVFAVPVLLWLLWKAGKPGLDGPLYGASPVAASNVLLIPTYVGNSTASLAAGLSSLSYNFGQWQFGTPPAVVDGPWGPPLAALAAIALLVRFRKVRPPLTALPWAVALLAVWASFALSFVAIARPPDSSRYLFPAAAIALPAAAIALSGVRVRGRALLLVYGVVALTLLGNVSLERSAGNYLRRNTINERVDFGVIQLARGHIGTRFAPGTGVLSTPLMRVAARADRYLPAADRIGPIGYSPEQIEAAPEIYREEGDQVLAEAYRLHLQPAKVPALSNRQAIPCERTGPGRRVSLPRSGAVLRSRDSVMLSVGRFAGTATAKVGTLDAGAGEKLVIPGDASKRSWFATFDQPTCVDVIPLSVPLSG